MRTKSLIILLSNFLIITSCFNSKKEYVKNYIESQPTFFDLKNEDWLTNKWIRQPKNLKVVHETFKKFGYSVLLSNDLLFDNPLIIQDIYINKTGKQLLDSLEISYNQPRFEEKFYREFWQRRKTEKNDKIVYQIIKDINYAFKHKMTSAELSLKANEKIINDTLLQLLNIDYRDEKITNEQAIADFETLKNLGFHNSAYNMLYENAKYSNIKWDKEQLEKSLIRSKENTNPWIIDNEP